MRTLQTIKIAVGTSIAAVEISKRAVETYNDQWEPLEAAVETF